mmetsp:Transcript_6756/g.13098  ORF Transcript_6756/g.13098 Transcript_6756/m.13098 type:complete len:135 (+) Transcript_6756:81-485(+)|eukprot:CAMPEP_0197549768 /NCGR_PEP_ID=MMETSP1320-20131121/3579_1 /TAXON_ID=91990 /ORGANISM="Bolidomonas sp., Strain RCC2347" /LENGTH=134 /DNA_ID=CAMNT_0043110041 /DNA_START=110 /DNA_END=514 /DNA_ORIENTATION=-
MKLQIITLLILNTLTDAFFVKNPNFIVCKPLHSSNSDDPTPHSSAQEIMDATEHATAWQEIWEYDAAMSNTYAGYFKVGNWLKAMPCGAALDQDCPNELLTPGKVAPQVDVMGFLGLKRQEGVKEAPTVPASFE